MRLLIVFHPSMPTFLNFLNINILAKLWQHSRQNIDFIHVENNDIEGKGRVMQILLGVANYQL